MSARVHRHAIEDANMSHRGQPDLMNIPHEGLAPGPNYRTTLDDTTIAELAESIASHGLLQNLVVTRPIDPAGLWVIVSGERRWRAIGLLIEQQRWPAERMIPCMLREELSGDVAGIRIAALIENLQREDVNAMEEAECFVAIRALAPDRFATEEIARAIGKTTRYVQQRLALAERLAPEIKDKVRAGTISVTQAREIAIAANPKTQAKLAAMASSVMSWDSHPDTLRRTALASLFPLVAAKFDGGLYDGEVLEMDGVEYLADRAQALKLQAAWAKEEAERIGGAFIEVKDFWSPGYAVNDTIWRRAQTAAEKKKARPLLVLTRRTGAVERYDSMTDAAVRVAADRAAAKKPTPAEKAALAADAAAWQAHRDACAALAETFNEDLAGGAGGPLSELWLDGMIGPLSPAAMTWLRHAVASDLEMNELRRWDEQPLAADAAAFLREIGIALPPAIRVAGEDWRTPIAVRIAIDDEPRSRADDGEAA